MSTELRERLVLRIRGNVITAETFGPDRDTVLELFGAAELPTAYRTEFGIERAAEAIRELNPTAIVEVEEGGVQ